MYRKAGYDPNFFDKIIQGIEKKKGAMASEKDIAAGQFLMTTGIEVFGARRGKEAEAFSKGAQKGLEGYAKAMERLKDRQDKLDDRVEQLRIADANAKRTGAESALARRNKLEEMKQNDERAVYQAEVQAATAGSQAAVSLTVADLNMGTQVYVADLNAQTQREFTNMVKAGQLEATKAKLITDAAGDFISKNANNPAFLGKPDKLKEAAIAFAYDLVGSTGVLPKGATIPQPRQFTPDELKQMYGLK
jgi:hypothetical protein